MRLVVPLVNHQLTNDFRPTNCDRLDSFDLFADRRAGGQFLLYQFGLRQNAPSRLLKS
jgi:hypothetical protein